MNAYSEFASGSILNRKMLCSLRDYPIELTKELFKTYPEGIISGFGVTVCENTLFVDSGIIKYENRILIMDESVELSITKGNWQCILDISLQNSNNCELTIVKPKLRQLDANERYDAFSKFELFRFVYNEGAVLRGIPDEFDLLAESRRNTIDIRYRSIAKPNMLYLPDNIILTMFAKTMLSKTAISAIDVAFAYLCLNGLENGAPLLHYLNADSNMSTYQLIDMLYEKIKSIREEKNTPKKDLPKQQGKIEIR